MSIRTSPQRTPQLLDAARLNGRRSHGPCTAAGKQNSKMNALEHGERSDPDNHYEVMRALGEDPAQFEALKQELSASFSTGDSFIEKQIDDLARLYWRRDRLERSQTGLMRRALLALDERQHRRRKEIEDCTMEVGEGLNVTHEAPSDPAARLRLLLSFLALIRLQVHGRSFLAWQAAALQGFYRNKTGWRGPRLCFLLSLFAKDGVGAPLVGAQADEQGGHEGRPYDESDEEDDVGVPLVGALADGEVGQEGRPFVATEPADELRYKQLVLLLADEVAAVEQEFEYEEKLNEEKTAIERDACLAPAGEEWRMLLRREESLERAIDRKIKLLLVLRKSGTGTLACAGVNTAGGLETGKSACPTAPACAEESMTAAPDAGAPLVGAQAHDEGGHEARPYDDVNEEPSPEGIGCPALAASSAGA